MLFLCLVPGLFTCALALHAHLHKLDLDAKTDAIIRGRRGVGAGDVADAPRSILAHIVTDLTTPSEPRKHASVKPSSSVRLNDHCAPYWLEDIKHQGFASFNPNPRNYTVFRNVIDFGAVGDGITDDTVAINRAISEGNRCAPGDCESSTNAPAVVYFPGGTYLISSSIIDYYYTQIIGNPNCLPTIVAASNFSTSNFGLIDGSHYQSSGHRANDTGFTPTNTFFRQIRNLVLDMTRLSTTFAFTGIHWPTAQATSLQNIVINMNPGNGTLHQGVFIQAGSGGFMTDLIFNGGQYGFVVGNQQFTTRNITFNNVDTAINQFWDWSWVYKSISINNCRVGFNISAGGPSAVNVGSITLLDSEINNTPIGIVTSRTYNSTPAAGGSLYLENVMLNNVGAAVVGPNSTYLSGSAGESVISAWADGHRYLPRGPIVQRGPIEPSKRPIELLDASGNFVERSKPQYGEVPLSQFLSARDAGVKGDGKTDDTIALNTAILKAKDERKILFLDAGFYKVTGTIYVPPGSKIVGEALASVILSAGDYFNNMEVPKAVLQIAQPGEQGTVELSDFIVSTQGQQKGATLIEYNLASFGDPAGLWDVHTRIGGFAGSNLQKKQCTKTPEIHITEENLIQDCIAAYLAMHITKSGTGLYMENNWLWTADHDLDDTSNNNTQLTIFAGRGLHIESQRGVLWLYGTGVEHHTKYEYQFVDTRNVFMGQIQTETAYYQPNPDATIPFPDVPSLHDPVFTPSQNSPGFVLPLNGAPSHNGSVFSPSHNGSVFSPSHNGSVFSPSHNGSASTAVGWGLRILRSNNILGYGVGLYSFFDNYSTNCSRVDADAKCQLRMLSIEGGELSHDIGLINVNTVGTTQMITRDGMGLAKAVDNKSTFVDTINVFKIGSSGL